MIRRLCVSCLAFFRHWNKNEWRTAWLLLLLLLLDPSVAACLCVLIYFVLPHSWNNRNNNRPTRETDLATPCTLHLAPDTLKPKTIYHLRTRPYDIDYNLLQTQGHPLHYTTHTHTYTAFRPLNWVHSFVLFFFRISFHLFSDFLISWFEFGLTPINIYENIQQFCRVVCN